MKKLKRRFKKLNNRGSSIVMVIVALAFIGIVVGALLSAAGYAYKLKMQNLNAKDNFYYVEQAMEEIYAGVGTHTVEQLKAAYNYTIENMVRYDVKLGTYKTISDAEANAMFKKKFIDNIKDSDYFKQGNLILADSLSNYISNETVKMDKEKLVLSVTENEITIKNITLTRTQEYTTTGSGTYTQTLSTDIVISEPDFEVNFNNLSSDYSTIYDFALIADMGVEITQAGTPLNIVGNVYAASDYYNKEYNLSDKTADKRVSETKVEITAADGSVVTYDYDLSSVTSKHYNDLIDNDYENLYAKDAEGYDLKFDGENINSMYSGLYIDNTDVSIMADTIIVPGTFSVMNLGSVSVYGKSGTITHPAEVWVDNFVLDGYSGINDEDETYEGAEAILRANLFVKDDTEINSAGASFTLNGSYYGYGDSTTKDSRIFVPTVAMENFVIPVYDENGKIVMVSEDTMLVENRGHYNSSAIIVNGQDAKLDLQNTNELFLAGRAYIELSKDNDSEEVTLDQGTEDTSDDVDVLAQTYAYMPTETVVNADGTTTTSFIRDYKTGESIAVKSSQLAYIPVAKSGIPAVMTVEEIEYIGVDLDEKLAGVGFFETLFPTSIFDGAVPVISQRVSGKVYYYYDFTTAYKIYEEVASTNLDAAWILSEYKSADDLAKAFVIAYQTEVALGEESVMYPLLTDYLNGYEDFSVVDVKAPAITADVYSSGVITTKSNNEFTMVTKDDDAVIDSLLSDVVYSSVHNNVVSETIPADSVIAAVSLSNDLEMEYNYMKWNLARYDSADLEKQYVNNLVTNSNYGESWITPINKYLVVKNIDTEITPSNLTLASGYSVWVSEGDDTLTITGDANVRGIVITKGDVIFGSDVVSFEGLIVSGGKIYIRNGLTNITASPEICRSILRECLTSSDSLCEELLTIFKEYENYDADDDGAQSDAITVDQITYTDVVSVTNWMKYVE